MRDKILGTSNQTFQIQKGGSQIKNNSGALEMRNSTDTGFAIARVASPVGNDDAVPKSYVTSNVKMVRFTAGITTAYSTAVIPANSRILRAEMKITTAYTAGALLALGHVNQADLLFLAAEIDAQTISSEYGKEPNVSWGGNALAAQLIIFNAPAVGACEVNIYYVETPQV